MCCHKHHSCCCITTEIRPATYDFGAFNMVIKVGSCTAQPCRPCPGPHCSRAVLPWGQSLPRLQSPFPLMQDAFDEEEEERAEENEQEKEGTNDEDLDREQMLYWEVCIRF